nr:6_t:CDS:2 [Entrophospora candida]
MFLTASEKPNAIFDKFIKQEHGVFLNKYLCEDPPLPSFNITPENSNASRIKINTPMLYEGLPFLLLYKLPEPGSDCKPLTRAENVLKSMKQAIDNNSNMLIMLGVSGCGPKDIIFLVSMLSGQLTEDFERNRQQAEHLTRCAILTCLFILKYCIMVNNKFNSHSWLMFQVCQKKYGLYYNYPGDIFVELMSRLLECERYDIVKTTEEIYEHLQNKLEIQVFPVILDEAQTLNLYKDKFRSRKDPDQKRPLISPLLMQCFILAEKFTDFGGWQDSRHVKSYTDNIIDLTEKEVETLHQHFHGHYHPIVTYIESMIKGKPCVVAVDNLWKILTTSCDLPDQQELSFQKQMCLVEYGLDQLQYVNSPKLYDLKEKLKTVDDDTLTESCVELSAQEISLTAYVNEPFVMTALYNFFDDRKQLPQAVLTAMTTFRNHNICEFLWENYLTREFECMFAHRTEVCQLMMFFGIEKKEFSALFHQSATIVETVGYL